MAEKKLPKGVTLRKDGRYMGRVQINGERVSLYSDKLSDLINQMEDVKYQMKHGFYCRPKEIRVDEWFNTWIDEYKSLQCKSQTIRLYRNTYKRYIQEPIGRKKVTDVKPAVLQKIINGIHKAGYSRSIITSVQTIIKGMFLQALRDGIIINNPAKNLTLPRFRKVVKEERRVMSKEETDIFLKYAEKSAYYDYYRLALCTGLRINEAFALQWDDIDWKRKMICIKGTLVYESGQGVRKDSMKTVAGFREIPMIDASESLLKILRKKRAKTRILLGQNWKEREGLENLVLFNAFGSSLCDTNVRKDINRIVERINHDGIKFKHVTPHTFRHTFATRGLEAGIPLKVMQTILGHSSLSMTADLYSHVLPDTKAEEMKKLQGII
ncbi:MAG: site-specific integrase [Lachnospiraceae bacterium]|nr:site-specific integrase [Lachnospiraceae bacterium]